MRVAIYARCSTNENKQDTERQVDELKTIASNFDWKVVKVYEDYASGSKSSRPALDQMMKDAHTRSFDIVMISSLCRLGRSLSHMVKLLDKLKKYKIDLYTKQEGISTNHAMGELFFNIISSINQFQLSQISENVRSGIALAKKRGKKMGRVPVLDKKKIEKIHKLRDEGLSYRKIAKQVAVSHGTIDKVFNDTYKTMKVE